MYFRITIQNNIRTARFGNLHKNILLGSHGKKGRKKTLINLVRIIIIIRNQACNLKYLLYYNIITIVCGNNITIHII